MTAATLTASLALILVALLTITSIVSDNEQTTAMKLALTVMIAAIVYMLALAPLHGLLTT
jgi:peptidoglycan/LPS O-acetylase OafA/YrhL